MRSTHRYDRAFQLFQECCPIQANTSSLLSTRKSRTLNSDANTGRPLFVTFGGLLHSVSNKRRTVLPSRAAFAAACTGSRRLRHGYCVDILSWCGTGWAGARLAFPPPFFWGHAEPPVMAAGLVYIPQVRRFGAYSCSCILGDTNWHVPFAGRKP